MTDPELDRLLRRVPEGAAEAPCLDDGELITYQRGQLSPERSATVELHLARCRECRQLLLGLSEPVSTELRSRAEGALAPPRASPIRRIAAASAGLGLALAAGLAMFTWSTSPPPLPEYQLEGPLGGIAATRGSDAKAQEFAVDGTIRVALRPSRAVATAVQLGVFRVESDRRLVDITGLESSVNADGGARWSAPVRSALGAAPGRYTLAIVISVEPPAAWAGVDLETARNSGQDARWWITEVTVAGDPQKN